jgi:hypothetical protein
MGTLKMSGFALALATVGTFAGALYAGECEGTTVCWGHCKPPAASCYPASPCGPQVCHYELVYPRCGPIRRLLGLCRPVPVLVCGPCCPPAVGSCPPASLGSPCPSCAAPPGSTAPPSGSPMPSAALSSPAPTPNSETPRYYSPPPANPQSPEPPVHESNFQPQRMPVPVPAQPLTPPLAPAPIRLDHFVSLQRG